MQQCFSSLVSWSSYNRMDAYRRTYHAMFGCQPLHEVHKVYCPQPFLITFQMGAQMGAQQSLCHFAVNQFVFFLLHSFSPKNYPWTMWYCFTTLNTVTQLLLWSEIIMCFQVLSTSRCNRYFAQSTNTLDSEFVCPHNFARANPFRAPFEERR